jgi:hypothetical protein
LQTPLGARVDNGVVDADDFEITVTQRAGVVRIAARGAYSRGRLERLIQCVITESETRGIARVLVDVTGVPGSIPTLDRYEVGVAAARAFGERRVAVVERPERNERFFETVARNRGASIRDFTDEAQALEWLLGAAD